MAEIYPGLTLAAFQAKHPEEVVNGGIKVCVGGGGGFIGSHIAKRLKEAVRNLQILRVICSQSAGLLCGRS